MADLLVVGSANLDISVPVAELPLPGETVLGGDALWSPGGKGANQAVAAARLGRSVAFAGCVGDDDAGGQLREALAADDIEWVGATLPGVPSGIAMIAVADGGENSITVSPGANARVDAALVSAAVERSEPAVVLSQFEVPLSAVAAASETAAARDAIVVINPAPAAAPSSALDAVLTAATVVVPNQGELAQLLGEERAEEHDALVEQARRLPTPQVVVTLGSRGALVVSNGIAELVPSISVDAVDTTAAGDAFCGGLADALADGADLVEAARWGTRVAAVAVTRRGAQVSLGTRADALAL